MEVFPDPGSAKGSDSQLDLRDQYTKLGNTSQPKASKTLDITIEIWSEIRLGEIPPHHTNRVGDSWTARDSGEMWEFLREDLWP